jgi:hypothetical protein
MPAPRRFVLTIAQMREETACAAASVLLAWVVTSAPAKACGVSSSGVASCSLAEHREEMRARWSIGATGTYTDTALRFDGSLRAEQTRAAALALVAYLPTPSVALELGAGVSFAGGLTLPDGEHTFLPGPSASFGSAFRVLDAPSYFALLTAALSFTANRTEHAGEPNASYAAFDLRLGGEFGLNIATVFHPYALARVFGGPVYWRYAGEAVTGTDIHHYQFGLGFALNLPARLALFAEGVPLGERAISGGLSLAF